MSKLYWVDGGHVKVKDGSSTSTVGDSGAIHVSQGMYNGKEAFVITYSSGDAKITTGSSTSKVSHGLSNKIVSTQFHDKGLILTNDRGERYYSYPGGGKKL
jgi:hypothetical protein